MKQERVILSFIMVLIGLLVAGSAFYFYQSQKQAKTPVVQTTISPTPKLTQANVVFLNITSPTDEMVVTNKTLKVSGKTNPEATIIIITKSDQQVLQPNSTGDFTTTVDLSNDQNLISIMSILPSGESKQIQDTVTYSTSSF